MRTLRILALLFLFTPCAFAQRIAVTITVTNQPTQAATFTLNGDIRAWVTNATATTHILISTNGASANSTNLYTSFAARPFSGAITLSQTGTNTVKLYGSSGQAMVAALPGDWGFLTVTTNASTDLVNVRVPISGEPSASVRTNNASQIVDGLNSYATNRLNLSTLPVGIVTNTDSLYLGITSNAVSATYASVAGTATNSINPSSKSVTNDQSTVNFGALTVSNIVMQSGTVNGGTALNGTQVPTADWVRRKFSNGQYLYPTTNAIATGFDGPTYTYSKTIPGFTSRSYTGITNNQYLGTVINPVSTFCANGPDNVNVVMGIDSTNGKTLNVVAETYFTYDKTNLFSESVSTASRSIVPGTNQYIFSFPRPAEVFTNNGAFWVRRLKASNVTGNPTLTVYQGTNATVTPSTCSYSAVNIPLLDIGNVISAHAQLSCTNTIVTAGVTSSNVVPWHIIEANYQMKIAVNDTKIYIYSPGSYLITASPVFDSGATEGVTNAWWGRINGTNIVRRATRIIFPTVSGGGTIQNVKIVPTVTFNVTFAQGDYFEMLWWGSSADQSVVAYPSQAVPPIPASPSIILTINQISAN